MLVVNLFGAPGSGKSTGAARIFSDLKVKGVNCELVTEYAKDKLYEGSRATFEDQIYIFGKQNFRLSRLKNVVDVVITDSPILLSLVYKQKEPLSFDSLVLDKFKEYNNLNVYLNRNKPYSQIGRFQNEAESDVIGRDIRKMLIDNHIPFIEMTGCLDCYTIISENILSTLQSKN